MSLRIVNSSHAGSFFVLCLLVIPCILQGQPEYCGFPTIDRFAQERAKSALSQRQLPLDRLIRVYFRVFRDDDGTSAAATVDEISSEFDVLLESYADGNICFANMGIDFIDNTALNRYIDVEDSSTYAPLLTYVLPSCITIFYHYDLLGAGGSSYMIPNIFCSIQRNNIGFARTIAHEIGHCFGLVHTFESVYGVENIDGTDCISLGDQICDTPADPYFWEPFKCFSVNGCLYTGTCIDPNGDSDYTPPYINIMSYWGNDSCEVSEITEDQYDRIGSYLSTDEFLLMTQSIFWVDYGPVEIDQGLHLVSAVYGLSTNENVLISNSATVSLQSPVVNVYPGFTAAPTSGSVTIAPTLCNY